MFSKWKGRRQKLALGASAAGAALVLVSMAAPAGAAITPHTGANYPAAPFNNTLVGSGSSTDYQMMIGLDALFDQVPGCVITSGSVTGAPASSSQQLNYSCETSTGVTGAPAAGLTLEQQPGLAYLDNPINDAAVEEPPMGSSNGIAQLELGRNQSTGSVLEGTNSENISAINYARSSRDPGSGDDKGLNFVAYARDGVAPLIFTESNSVKTSFGKTVSTAGLTTAQLQDIYNGTIYDWGQIPGVKFSAPIYVYSGQEGSGTQSTFKTFLGFDPSAAANHVNCTDPVAPNTKVVVTPSKAAPNPTFGTWNFSSSTPAFSGTATLPNSATCLGPDVIFENEDASILANASTPDGIASAWKTANGSVDPVGDSIFFYSWGKFNLQCEGLKSQTSFIDKSKTITTTSNNGKAGADCGSTPLPSTDKLTLTPVNGVAPSASSILGGGSVFPVDRFLYNIYSNGSNTNLPPATAATLNYVSEVGFLCKPQTVDATAAGTKIVDPANGTWYHTEIFNTIVANGFVPVTATGGGTFATLADGAPAPENAGSGADTNTAYNMLNTGGVDAAAGTTYLGTAAPGQSTNTSISTSNDPLGYCILSNTDGSGNANS
jgi:ABC-type phosphate transport system substrate-binding protein